MRSWFRKKIKQRFKCNLDLKKPDTISGDGMFFFLFRSFCSVSFVFFVLFCITPLAYSQSDPQFSQNMFNPLVVNPGFAGHSGQINLVAVDRHQWVGLEGAPRTTVVGADMAINNFFGNPGGVGLVVMNDEIGFFRNITINGSIAQRYFVGDGRIGVGLTIGLFNQVFDGTKVRTGTSSDYHSDEDPSIDQIEYNGTAFDSGVGVWYEDGNIYAGLSILHLFEPKPNFNEELNVYTPRSFYFTAGYSHTLYEVPVTLKPSFFLKNSSNSWQLDLNMNMIFRERYWGGLSYRIQDAVVLLGGVELQNGLKIGYSYDITTSKLSRAGSGGSHEIMVGYTFDLSLNRREKRYRSVRFL
ncbi:type IX secretion system membrane protein, PorP/SprF family [Alkalitalea saponilacus]|uniref:Type IX secretion system membrane protein, PorP/SprF family n=2 Tax=Alkalitalea saponilacus TaxID=889453 RepID=A0A1T5HMA8_9BACT|nr:type IX secretion system membrane protein, PorP/SprF family [Alkalitalea saponilacus]